LRASPGAAQQQVGPPTAQQQDDWMKQFSAAAPAI
jgi:hypothetical protein